MILLFQTILYLLLFLVTCFFVFYTTGFLLVKLTKTSLERQDLLALSFCLGTVVFSLVAIILGILNLRFLMIPLLIIIIAISIFKNRLNLLDPWKIFIKDKVLLILIIAGILIQGFINFPSGYLYKEGLMFWSSQGHDGLWHVATMEEIKKTLPPQNPAFSGEPLFNYHYLVDVYMGEFSRIFPFFTTLDLYFRFFPVILSFMIGTSVYALMMKWRNNRWIALLALFFIYGVGSFGYIASIIRGGSILSGETTFWAAQQNTILGNPPHAISHSLLPATFLSMIYYFKTRSKKWLLITFIIGGTLAGYKVSGGLVMLIGLGLAALIDALYNRKFQAAIAAFFLGLSNLITFKSMTSPDAVSFLMFLPWWFVRTMVVDKLGWIDLEHKRQHYLAQGTWHATLRAVQLETEAFLIFVVGNLGMRVLGLFEMVKKGFSSPLKFISDPIEMMFIGSMLTGLVIPIFFVQKGLIYNNIQFMQYFMLIFGFYAAVVFYKIIIAVHNQIFRLLIILLVVLLSIPTVIGNLVGLYGPGRVPLSNISNQELQALKILKDNSNPQDVILNLPFNKNLQYIFTKQPKPIFSWYSTSYITALTGRTSYLASQEQVLITGYPLEARLAKVEEFFNQTNFDSNKDFLKDNGIKFLYIPKQEVQQSIDVVKNNLDLFYENNEVTIYRVKI